MVKQANGVAQPNELAVRKEFANSPFEPAPRDNRLVQCLLLRDSVSSTFSLFAQQSRHSSFTSRDHGKFLLAARQIKHMTSADFKIHGKLEGVSELEEESESYNVIAILRSNFSRRDYTLYDCRAAEDDVDSRSRAGTAAATSKRRRATCFNQSHPVPHGSQRVADIGYSVTFGKPQQFECVIHTIPASSVDAVGTTDFHHLHSDNTNSRRLRSVSQRFIKYISGTEGLVTSRPGTKITRRKSFNDNEFASQVPARSSSADRSAATSITDPGPPYNYSSSSGCLSASSSLQKSTSTKDYSQLSTAELNDAPLVLRTRAYQWDSGRRQFVADFRRDEMLPSYKNFQLVSEHESLDAHRFHESVLLQFGLLSPGVFFMDYRYPLSPLEAFGICLSRFS